jgi:hypothetical protein
MGLFINVRNAKYKKLRNVPFQNVNPHSSISQILFHGFLPIFQYVATIKDKLFALRVLIFFMVFNLGGVWYGIG